MYLTSKILGSENRFTLEDRILNAVLFVVIQIGLLSLIINLVNKLGFVSYLYASVITLAFAILYFIGRRSSSSRYLVWPFIFFDITPVVFTWYFYGGISGTSLIYVFSLIIVVPIITQHISRIIALSVVIMVPFVLFWLQITGVINVKDYANHSEEMIDTLFSFVFLAIGSIIVIILLIGAYRKQKAELEANNKAKDKFFSIIAHDLKGPLGSIIQLGELMGEDEDILNGEFKEVIIKSLQSSSRKTYDLLDNLLQWASSETGLLKSNAQLISLKEIAEANSILLEEKIQNKEINLKLNLDPDSIIFADENMINTIVRNLISNAVKFTPNKGSIEITAFKNQSERLCTLQIRDNGVGIKKEAIHKIFSIDSDYFTKGTNNESGTGLGLKLCKEFVDKNNGTIRVESEENKGTAFTISFPCADNKGR